MCSWRKKEKKAKPFFTIYLLPAETNYYEVYLGPTCNSKLYSCRVVVLLGKSAIDCKLVLLTMYRESEDSSC